MLGESGEDLHSLGEALKARTEDVVRGMASRTSQSGHALDAMVEDSFAQVGSLSTVAVAKWMAGEGPEAAREAGKEAWQIFGQLAAQRAAPLDEVTKRCLRWRDAAEDVVRESASELGVSRQVLSQALDMLKRSLDATLVRVCSSFEAERRRADEELTFLATHDSLTGLPNRALICDRAEQMLVRARRTQSAVAALFVDLDNFKGINDTFGHGAGDELLRAVAVRLDGVVRGADALGRLAGDEFVVISEQLSLAAGPELIAERLLDALSHSFELAGGEETRVIVTASIGIAAGAFVSAEELLRDAAIAMHRAKWDGKNRYVAFETEMQDAVQNRMALEMDLREALGNDEFFLLYQPTFDLLEMTPSGVEALIRWKHPVRGIVGPDDFIPLLEETGLIVEVGRWVMKEACRQAAVWRAAGYPIGMAVNVSGRQLDTDELIGDIEDALSSSGLEPGALTIEITETTLMRNVQETARRLADVKRLGVRVAIDDFGTGYSSLAHLQRFPVDALKIDRSFIAGLAHNEDGKTLIRTLVALGKALSIETLAEGIEQPRELSILREEQCDSGQGFLFARPLDVASTEQLLRSWAVEHTTPAMALAPQPSW